MTLTAAMRRLGRKETVHGFRSTFSEWAAEQTNYPEHLRKFALAHKVRDKVDAAYQRSTLLAKRALLMQDWADYCDRIEPDGKVIPFAAAARA